MSAQIPTPPVRTRQRPTPTASATPSLNIELVPIDQLKRADRQLRRRKKKLIQAHAANITTHGYAPPLLALRSGDLIQGHDHLEAYHLLKRSHAPVIVVDDRPPEQVAAMKLWLERFEAAGDWDWEMVAAEFELICEIDPQWLPHTLWEAAEIDLALLRGGEPPEMDDEGLFTGPACAISGDLFQWNTGHRLLVGNARDPATVARLMDGRLAHIAAVDPPYGTTVSRISSKHLEFLEGSGMDTLPSPHTVTHHLGSLWALNARVGCYPTRAARNVPLRILPGHIDEPGATGHGACSGKRKISMTANPVASCTAFVGDKMIASGAPVDVALALKAAGADVSGPMPLVFNDATGEVMELDLRGAERDIVARFQPKVEEPPRPGRGRPKMGVTAREVTLMPKHWEWLSKQPGGASAALRRLVEAAAKTSEADDAKRALTDRVYKVMYALAGHLPGYEEASRKLFAGDLKELEVATKAWPADLRGYILKLAT